MMSIRFELWLRQILVSGGWWQGRRRLLSDAGAAEIFMFEEAANE